MNIFKKIFKRDTHNEDTKNNVTIEHFFKSEYVKNLIKNYRKETFLLRPHKSSNTLGIHESKFGGTPNFEGHDNYPLCDSCKIPLNFILQLYKKDFPTLYFPDGTNIFQLFRCPNKNCPESYTMNSDLKMFPYFFDIKNIFDKKHTKPSCDLKDIEKEIPDCYLKPTRKEDFPNYDDFKGNDFHSIEKMFGDESSEAFMEKYFAAIGSKIGGYPSYIQPPNYPKCSCGKDKEFFFQLSSEDIEDGVDYPPDHDKWSPHGIMIGDVGNIYFYVCKSCGPQTIEYNWDCY